ncbi:MAG: Peptidoglycan lytic protein P45 [uncultured Sulfurovum sp.]|uniref:Peptidoglycan lytic protein P45 n=1 Tax=uncultured Sulfurovum sp. TaxID=269237 RepID=A0A6S6T2B8_9BACT|nr:MAG: Peptidoglycan lytic protein P45 [uncultured Sulfurovum sp.]
MDLFRNILLGILFLQFLIFLYVKLIDEPAQTYAYTESNQNIQKQLDLEALVNQSINEIMHGSKELPQSSEYTLWDKEMIDQLNKEIQSFNDEIKKIVEKTSPIGKEQIVVQKAEIKKEKIIPKISMTKKVEKYAKGKLGQKYVWGATGPKTFDCSGFTKDVYKSTTGIKIPRVSRDQAKVGTYVKYEELKRGDMVFFDTEKKYTGKVNHVGIYLSANNFIHASSAKKKVIITNFKKKPFYKKRFLWGRRIVKNAS